MEYRELNQRGAQRFERSVINTHKHRDCCIGSIRRHTSNGGGAPDCTCWPKVLLGHCVPPMSMKCSENVDATNAQRPQTMR